MTFRDILRAELVRVNRGLQDCEVLEARGHDVSNLAASREELRREQTELLELVGSVPADTIKALINSLRQDARCGDAVRWPDPVDDYAMGLEQASQELEELLEREVLDDRVSLLELEEALVESGVQRTPEEELT